MVKLKKQRKIITQKQAVTKLTVYLENEIISKVIVASQCISKALSKDIAEDYVKRTMDDIEEVVAELLRIVRKNGFVIQRIKFIGDISFSENDILTLKRYLGI